MGQGTDFTIATSVKQAREVGVNNVTVPLEFKHKLAKIDVTINLSQQLVDNGYLLNKGTSGSVPTGVDTLYWASLTIPFNEGEIDVAVANPVWTLIPNTPATFTRNRTFLILPQTYDTVKDSCVIQFKNIIISRNNTVVFQDSLKSYKLKATDVPDSTFYMGKLYSFNFTLTTSSYDAAGNPIFGDLVEFSSTVVDWGDENVSITQP